MNFENVCKQVQELVINTGDFIKNARPETIETKGKHDFVTSVDKKSEEKLVAGLRNILPEAGFIVEEKTSEKQGETYQWIIDPLDGTTNFIHGLPPYAISVALVSDKEILLGVIYEVITSECFYAWKGSKAYLNGKEIHVTQTEKIEDSLIATGFPFTNFSKMDEFMDTLTYFMKHSHGLRRLGSAATDLAYLACGRFDGFYEYALKPWDVAAGVIIIQQAGGKVCDFSGGDDYLFGQEIVASNSHIFNQFSTEIKRMMQNSRGDCE